MRVGGYIIVYVPNNKEESSIRWQMKVQEDEPEYVNNIDYMQMFTW